MGIDERKKEVDVRDVDTCPIWMVLILVAYISLFYITEMMFEKLTFHLFILFIYISYDPKLTFHLFKYSIESKIYKHYQTSTNSDSDKNHNLLENYAHITF